MFDCVIIGAGPAGLTGGIYLKRKNLDVIILEKNVPGGQLTQTSTVDNYPGYEHITGSDLASNMYMQVINLGVKVKKEEALKIEVKEDYFNIITNKREYQAKTVLLALGMVPSKLGFTNEDKFSYKGISWCAICDGPLYKDKEVCVVGGGNSALEESLYLASICKKVYLVHRRDSFKAEESLVEKVKMSTNIEIITNDTIKEASKDVHILITFQLAKGSARQRYYTQDNTGISKNMIDVVSTTMMIRDLFDDEKSGGKNPLKVFRLEGKSKIPVQLNADKHYQIIFIVKNREGSANQFQVVVEHDMSRNMMKEVGITCVTQDF